MTTGQMFYKTQEGSLVPINTGPKGDTGGISQAELDATLADYPTTAEVSVMFRTILSGTGDPPDPTGLADGTLYLRRDV